MESTLTFKDGYKFGVEKHALLEECRKQGEEFLRGRAQNKEGKYVYDIITELNTKKNELHQIEDALAGYRRYKVLHPLQYWRDEGVIAYVIMSEQRVA